MFRFNARRAGCGAVVPFDIYQTALNAATAPTTYVSSVVGLRCIDALTF